MLGLVPIVFEGPRNRVFFEEIEPSISRFLRLRMSLWSLKVINFGMSEGQPQSISLAVNEENSVNA